MGLEKYHSSKAYLHEYYMILLCIITAVILTAIIILTSYLLAQQKPNAEKKTAYECGFEPFEDARGQVDVKFCILAILFIVFDVEVVFLAPWCYSLSSIKLLHFWVGVEFILELGTGLFYVWAKKALNW